jgi:hypothetical protein
MKKKLTDITPPKYKCDFEASCPAVFKSDQQTYIIVGKTVTSNEYSDLRGRISSDETAIEIACDLIDVAIFAAAESKKVQL